ncbi:nuclear transport factor 2 family protein [Bailinhaonella thermotolerans]|uniref:Nuclear transport factor 2 family protein n=1 Tax=Bailinhaonella thermotolerans TaxID=1070861 RepID=A0A3A4B5I7_9ACTN|nr:nuclear transport factor 2 family protein [Bailinhaonella thermotolerans]RJL35890.1 nuclear transport factor 2 family protein [Bailinhaonella thermotolerans]
MATTRPGDDPAALTELYVEVQRFYARHLQALDRGDVGEWARGFTEDGVFRLPPPHEPLRGRAALAESLGRFMGAAEARGERHRHWHGMLDVRPGPGGTVEARCYALVILSTAEGSRLYRACVCEDVFVREDGDLRVRDRRVTRDDHLG